MRLRAGLLSAAVCALSLAFSLAISLTFSLAALAADPIRIVGSSTVFPFSSSVAERFGRSGYTTPVVESTGTGGGMKLFCSGVGARYADITNASRRIKRSEYQACASRGVEIIEVKIGFDGIVLAYARGREPVRLTQRQIFQALAARVPVDGVLRPNPYRRWSEIDSSLPRARIEVLGPPPTSGTRDAFVEIAMEAGAKTFAMLKALSESDKKRFQAIAHAIREDGHFIEAGENDNLIVQKLRANPRALGIFGFSFLDNNRDLVEGAEIEGAAAEFAAIARGAYPIARSLFFYAKKNHIARKPEMRDFLRVFTSERAVGEEGYLADKGLIPLSDAERRLMRAAARSLETISWPPAN